MERVLVPVDGSDASTRAAAWAATYAATSGAELILLHVHDARGSETLALGALDATQIAEAERRIAGPSFDTAREAIGPATAARTLVSIGDPAEEIVALARREHATLIVMGSRGLGSVAGMLLGSVATKVMHLVDVPVTLVK